MTDINIFNVLDYNVSRETQDRLVRYVRTLEKWQKAINLIGKSTMDNIWQRHILDSAQLLKYIDKTSIADLGSGAGFPGMVLAILNNEFKVSLIESDIRKCEFLKEVKRVCEVDNVKIINKRIECIENTKFDYITSRALASVSKLLDLSKSIKKDDTVFLFLKGEKIKDEINEAEKSFVLKYEIYDSISDNNGKILKIQEVQ